MLAKIVQNDILTDIGKRIREIRTELGLSIKQLADKVGISYLTMQRIETDKLSPSVVLLAQISASLNYPMSSLLLEPRRDIIHIKSQQQNVIDTRRLVLKTVVPRGAVDENISIVHGKAEKGKFVSKHKHFGFELAYVLKGKALYKGVNRTIELNEGDLIFWNADEWHEVIALEPHEWLGMQFYSETIKLRDRVSPDSRDKQEEK
jgi:transcriptional regulator with XRE-family HTH domain